MSRRRWGLVGTLLALGFLVGTLSASSAAASAARSPRHSPVLVSGVSVLESVACPSAKVCIAVGSDENLDGKTVVITTSTGAAKARPGSFKFTPFNAVVCPSTTRCLAVADDAAATVKVPDGATKVTGRPKPPKNGIVALSALACPTKTNCYAVGFEGSEASGTGLLVHLSSTGTVLGETKSTASGLGPIACPSSTLCLLGVHAPTGEWIELLRSGSLGKKHALPNDTYVAAISCYKAKVCFALVGDSSSGVTNELFTLNPKTGRIGKVVTFSGFSGSGLTCPSANRCLVVGNTGSGSSFRPAVDIVTNGKPAKPVNYPGTSLDGIACATPRLCYAVGVASSEAIVERI